MDAHERGDATGLAEMLREDVRVTMPPLPQIYDGIDALRPLWEHAFDESVFGEWRLVATRVNRMPAAASYLRRTGETEFRAFKLDVLRVEGDRIAEITTFGAQPFARPRACRRRSPTRLRRLVRGRAGRCPTGRARAGPRALLVRRAGGDHALAQGRRVGGVGSTIVQCRRPTVPGGAGGDAAAAPDVEAEVVVVAAGGDERGRVEQRHHLEADHVAVEREPALDVADVQVHVADDRVRGDVGDRLLVGDEREQAGDVERLRAAERGRVGEVAPALAPAVGRELDAVAVGIGQVDRLGDAVVGRAADARAGGGEPLRGARQLERARGAAARSGRGRRGGRRGRALAVLDEDEQVLAAGAERGAAVLAAVQPQADRVLVEGDRAVEVGDGQLDGAHPQRRGEDRSLGVGLGRGHGLRIAARGARLEWQDVTHAWTSRAHASR